MFVTILLSALVSILLVAAFRGVFGDFPEEWEWVGMVFAISGLVLAMPTIVQMLWGQWRLEQEFLVLVENNYRQLSVLFKNPPVKRRISKRLGASRDPIHSLVVSYRLREKGSNTIIVPVRQLMLWSDDDPSDSTLGRWRISLPPTYSVGASTTLARWDCDDVAGLPGAEPDPKWDRRSALKVICRLGLRVAHPGPPARRAVTS